MEGTITPRWEWRAFGPRFPTAEPAFAASRPGPAQASDELYLLADSDANVKVRDDLLDIKLLREVDADGLQRWEPVVKEGFPLDGSSIGSLFDALGLATPRLSRDAYTLDQLMSELVEPTEGIRAVPVHKRRARSTLGGCMAELTEIGASGRTTWSVAVESEDSAAVIATVRDLGLDGYVNTHYPAGLTALIEDLPLRVAVIDCGTNSVKFLVAEVDRGGAWRPLVERAEVTRLGEGLDDDDTIQREPLERTASAIAGMVQEARTHDVSAIAAVGTAGLRRAHNRDEAVAAIRNAAGITVEVIPGDHEARLAYLGVLDGLGQPDGSVVVFDTGGGSSQFTFGEGTRIDERFSVDVGAVRYTERFGLDGAVAPSVLEDAAETIGSDLSRIDGHPHPDVLVGMGGAVTNITAVKLRLDPYDPERVQGATLERDELDRQIELFRATGLEDRRTIVGLQPKRAEVILAGACIVRRVMETLGKDELTVSDRGLRHGVLLDRFVP